MKNKIKPETNNGTKRDFQRRLNLCKTIGNLRGKIMPIRVNKELGRTSHLTITKLNSTLIHFFGFTITLIQLVIIKILMVGFEGKVGFWVMKN